MVKPEPRYKKWDYKILLCSGKKQIKYIGIYHDLEEVEIIKEKIKVMNKDVRFPVQYLNSHEIKPSQLEYIILKRKTETDSDVNKIQNEYGKFTDHTTTSDDWVIVDKMEYLKEESFWVYGKHPKKDRKEYGWIVENLIDDRISSSDIVQVFLYNNKVMFKYDNDFEFLICKNVSDAIRMYNMIEEEYKQNRSVCMTGMVKGHTDRANEVVKMIQEKTGWELYKIYRTSTRS